MNLRAIISADISQLERAFDRARSDASKTARSMDEAFRRSPDININTRAAQRQLRDLERIAHGSAGGIRRAFSGIGASIGGGLEVLKGTLGASVIQSALSATFDTMKAGLSTGIEFNKMLETGEIRLRRFFENDQATRAFTQQIQDFARVSPVFQLPEALTGAQRLLDMKFRASEVIPALSAIGEAVGAVGGNAETIDSVTLALSQMTSKGRISAEEMLQLTEANLPAWELLAKAIGKTEMETRKLVEAGRIDARRGVQGIIAMAGEKFAGQSGRAAQTLAGQQSQFESTLQETLGRATRGSFDKLKEGYAKATEGLATQGAQGFATEIDKLLVKEAETMRATLDKIASGAYFTQAAAGTRAASALSDAGKSLAAGDLGKTAESIGQAVKEGFNTGVLGPRDSVDKALVDYFGKAIEAVKKLFDSHSPSRVFAEIGAGVIEGFNLGLEAGKRKAPKQIIDVEALKKRILEDLKKLRDDPAIRAMLDTIAFSEGADYNTLFGGGTIKNLTSHPNQRITRKLGGKSITSTAAGRYQFLSSTWEEIAKKLGLTDFSAESQDLAAISLMKSKGMIGPVRSGDIAGALTKGNRAWASLPGSPYGQPTKESADLIARYNDALERLTGITSTGVSVVAEYVSLLKASIETLTRSSIRPTLAGAGAIGPATIATIPPAPILARDARLPIVDTSNLAGKALDMLTGKMRTLPPAMIASGAALEAFGSQAGSFKDAIISNTASLAERLDSFKGRLGASFDGIIDAFIQGGDGWKRAALSTVNEIFSTLIQETMLSATGGKYGSLGGLIGGALSGLFGSFFKFGGTRAGGGPVEVGKSYLVGEQGPELFQPKYPGRIVDNRTMQTQSAAQAANNITINFSISAPAGSISRETQSQIAARTAEALNHAVRRNG